MPRGTVLDPRVVGKLKRRFLISLITIQNPPAGTDAEGNVIDVWTDWQVHVQAAVAPVRPKDEEILVAQQLTSQTFYRVVIAYLAGVMASQRVKLEADGRILEVRNVLNLGTQNQLMELLCEEMKASPQ